MKQTTQQSKFLTADVFYKVVNVEKEFILNKDDITSLSGQELLVDNLISNQLKEIPRSSIARQSLSSNGISMHISSDKKIIDVVNKIAPEHLELNVKNYKSFVPKIKSSGSICLGKYAVMAMTDYNVGSNHILPTNGSAKYSSGVSVNEFYKRISYINLSKKGIESLGPSVITLANYEGLAGHAQSVKKRIRRK